MAVRLGYIRVLFAHEFVVVLVLVVVVVGVLNMEC